MDLTRTRLVVEKPQLNRNGAHRAWLVASLFLALGGCSAMEADAVGFDDELPVDDSIETSEVIHQAALKREYTLSALSRRYRGRSALPRTEQLPTVPASPPPAPTAEPPTTPPPAPTADLPLTTDGFTAHAPSQDSRAIYVSSSAGDDANDGLSEDAPVASVQRALSLARHGYPDFVYFKRGDVWNGGFGQWRLSGRSAHEPMVITAYGDGERPRFDFSGSAIYTNGGGNAPASTDFVSFVSLHFSGATHDVTRGAPSGPNPECLSWLRPATDLVFEDVRFQYCQVTVQAEIPGTIARWRFFRSQFLDSYSLGDGHAQGIFLFHVNQFVIEESMFDHCGWHPDVAQAVPTIFNHCIYWQKDSAPDGVVKNNVILRASSHGAQMRSNGHLDGNVIAQAAIGGFLSDDFPGSGAGSAIGNLFTEGTDILPREGHQVPAEQQALRGWAFELLNSKVADAYTYDVRDNIVTHCISLSSCRTLPSSFPNATLQNNTVWDWGQPASGSLQAASGPFVDPSRTLGSYNASLGGVDSFDAFADEVRAQSKTHWRSAYTAPAVIKYFRDGFAPR